jgi:hypothetical protein
MDTQRFLAVLLLPSGMAPFLARGDEMLAKMLDSAFYTGTAPAPTPTPTLAAYKNDLDALRAAQAVKGTGPAAVQSRNNARKQVRRDMENLRIFAQQLADANPAQAALIIASAGMYVKKVTVRIKAELAIVQGATTGSAIARAKSRGPRTTYWWQVSTDMKTWVAGPTTRVAHASFANLTPATLYYFRFQTLTKAGMSDWSQIISFIVK